MCRYVHAATSKETLLKKFNTFQQMAGVIKRDKIFFTSSGKSHMVLFKIFFVVYLMNALIPNLLQFIHYQSWQQTVPHYSNYDTI